MMSMYTTPQSNIQEGGAITLKSVASKLQGTLNRDMNREETKTKLKVKELATKFTQIWHSITAKKRHWIKRQKVQTTNQHSPELFEICRALGRVSHSEFIYAGEEWGHQIVKWPVETLKNIYALTVPPPYHTKINPDVEIDLSEFLDKLPDSMRIVNEKADPKKLINLMLPGGVICDNARKVGAAFWLWLCITDDILEEMNDQDFIQGIHDMHSSLAGSTNAVDLNSESQISFVTRLFREMIYTTSISSDNSSNPNHQWQPSLIACIQEIAQAFELERPLLKAGRDVRLKDWMKLRVVTISARPFMILAKASLDISGGMSRLGNPLLPNYENFTGKPINDETDLVRLETTLQCILGLQNDILGWEKDNHDDSYLNCVQIMGANTNTSTSLDYRLALNGAIRVHNQLVKSALTRASEVWGCNKSNSSKIFSVNQSQRNSPAPSVVTGKATTTDISLRISDFDLQPVIAEVNADEVETLEKKVSFRLFGCTIKVLWSPPPPQQPRQSMESFRDGNASSCDEEQERTRQYVRVLLNMANGMANWMVNSKRYAVKKRE